MLSLPLSLILFWCGFSVWHPLVIINSGGFWCDTRLIFPFIYPFYWFTSAWFWKGKKWQLNMDYGVFRFAFLIFYFSQLTRGTCVYIHFVYFKFYRQLFHYFIEMWCLQLPYFLLFFSNETQIGGFQPLRWVANFSFSVLSTVTWKTSVAVLICFTYNNILSPLKINK